MISIGRITLPLLIVIIAICKAGVTELNVIVNPKPTFQNRTNATIAPTPAPVKLSPSEQEQVNNHMKKTLEVLNSMTPKQRAQALIAMSTSDSALDQYVCNMISESDRVLVRHMNEKLNLIKSIPEDQRPQILAAMLKSNNSADRNLADVIMKHNKQGGDKNGKRLQAISQLGAHDRAELLKRMANSTNPDDRELATKILSIGKNGNHSNTAMLHNSNVSSPTTSPVIPNNSANGTFLPTLMPASPANSSNAANSTSPQFANSTNSQWWMPISNNNNLSSVAPSETPRSVAVNATQMPSISYNTSSMTPVTPSISYNTSTMAPIETPRPTSSYVPQLQAPSGNATIAAPSEIQGATAANALHSLSPANNASTPNSTAISLPASTNVTQFPAVANIAAPVVKNISATTAPVDTHPTSGIALQLPTANMNVSSTTLNISTPLNQSLPLAGVNNKTATTDNNSLLESPVPAKNISDKTISTMKPDFKNIAMLWNASNTTDDKDIIWFNSTFDKRKNSSNQDTSVKPATNATSKLSPDAKPADDNKTIVSKPGRNDDIIFGAPIPSWLSPESDNSKNAGAAHVDDAREGTQPWTHLNEIPEQNATDSINPGTDAMLTIENSKLTMLHFEEPAEQIKSTAAAEKTDANDKVNPDSSEEKLNSPSNGESANSQSHEERATSDANDEGKNVPDQDRMNHVSNEREPSMEGFSSAEEMRENEKPSEAEASSIKKPSVPIHSSSEPAKNGSLEEKEMGSESKKTILIQTSPEQSSWFDAIAGYLPSITAYHHSLYAEDDDVQPILEHIGVAPVPSKTVQLSVEQLGDAPVPSTTEQLPVPDYAGLAQTEADAANDVAADAANEMVADAANEMTADAANDMAADIANDMAADAVPDVAADVANNMAADAANDMAADAVPDVAADAANDMAADAVPDVAADAVPDVAADAVPDVAVDAATDMADDDDNQTLVDEPLTE